MSMIVPLFDALAHPTVSGRWLGRSLDATFETLVQDMARANFRGACAVGMARKDGYSHVPFIERCSRYQHLVPIAGLHPLLPNLEAELDLVTALGFRGVKVHPRFSNVDLERDCGRMVKLLQLARERELVVFLCTYFHTKLTGYPVNDPFYSLITILQQAPRTQVVLVHGGDVRVMQYAELVRHNPNLLLDLSLTMMKYQGSSIDDDVRFLFQLFDRRICIGTDHPEYSHQAVRRRFEMFSEGISAEKKHNIAYRNIETFLGLTP